MYKPPKHLKQNKRPDEIKFNKTPMTIRTSLYVNKERRFFSKTYSLFNKMNRKNTLNNGEVVERNYEALLPLMFNVVIKISN